MTEAQHRFVSQAVRRKNLFFALSLTGIAVALLLTAFYTFRRWSDPAYPLGARAAIVVLVLLNARQNLRQYRYAGVLEDLAVAAPGDRPAGHG